MRLSKKLIKFKAIDHGLHFVANINIYDALLLANVYINISTFVIGWTNN